ncbi:hypothetical protein [Haladaptatus halobius]|uniref:hypothetical protein n=1 Tax=Haladaptatus halobius TaxID=2884875 RepID=UPI001D0AD6FB|nr:hypothetical protein [Haladaptatus halobius]
MTNDRSTDDQTRRQSRTRNDRTRSSGQTRRRFLAVTGGALVGLSAVSAVSTAQQTPQPAESFRLGGEVQAWQGRAPQSISGQQNPTLQLQAGQVYEVTWENLDGQPHNFALQNSDGQNLAVIFPDVQTNTGGGGGNQGGGGGNQGGGQVQPPQDAIEVTETVSQQGATQTLRFVATQDVARYVCVIHPTTMVGQVNMQGGGGGGSGGSGSGGSNQGGGGGDGGY